MTRIWYNHGYSQTRDAFALLRAAAGSDIVLIASHADAHAPLFLAADHWGVEPAVPRDTPDGETAYVEWCLAFAAAHRVELFVPQRARAAIARHADAFARLGVRLILAADAAMLELIEDKARFYAASAAAALPTPLFHEIGSVAAFDTAVAAIRARGFDVCVKPPHGVFAAGYWRLCDDIPLFDQLMNPDSRRLHSDVMRQALLAERDAPPRLLVMQHLPGVEWSIDAICRDGDLLTGVARRKEGVAQVIETSGAAMDLAARVARTFRLSNLVNIQLKAAGPDGADPHVLEINPRMSGGCLYAALAGLNLPWLQIQNARGDLRELPAPTAPTVAPVHAAVDLGPLLAGRAHA